MCSQIVLKPKQAYLEEDNSKALHLFSLKVMSLTERKKTSLCCKIVCKRQQMLNTQFVLWEDMLQPFGMYV